MNRNRAAFALSAVLGFVIWALSRPITGKVEPWDANSPYYYVALVAAGFASGYAIAGEKKAHYLGAVVGQVLYGVIFLHGSALFILGVLFLFLYSLLYLAGVALALRLKPPAVITQEEAD